MWVRGLKLETQKSCKPGDMSHPMWVRGLKHPGIFAILFHAWSHPMWVRGLKPLGLRSSTPQHKVASHVGAWSETPLPVIVANHRLVAPHVGAWIETTFVLLIPNCASCRTPCGCVDWNTHVLVIYRKYFRSHPMWVRGLKQVHCSWCCFGCSSHPMWVRGLKRFWVYGGQWLACQLPPNVGV